MSTLAVTMFEHGLAAWTGGDDRKQAFAINILQATSLITIEIVTLLYRLLQS